MAIATPASGATLSGTVSITASVSAATGVAWVQFQLDGSGLGPQLTSAPYTISLDTTKLAAGAHTIAATVRDQAGNSATSVPVPVTISNTCGSAALRLCGAEYWGIYRLLL
ncbi:MAG: Ig-like domain-containing protein [Ignavibacteriota bacterium]